jgi:dihydrodipicolinate synthase/N-acetylneuraminate lyase
MAESHFPFKGIIPPLVTPLSDRERIDGPGLERLIEHVIAGGVHGLFLLGTSGEAPSLSHGLQRQFLDEAIQRIAGRVPVLAGVTDTAPAESLSLARYAADLGADALVLAAPHYFPMHQADLERYVRDLAEELPLPFLLYNMPSHTKVAFTVETVERLLELPNFAGVKDSSGDMQYFNKLIELSRPAEDPDELVETSARAGEAQPRFSLLMGPEELLAESVLMGGHGGICGGANLVPRLYVDLYEAALTGDLREVHRLQHQVLRLSRSLYEVGAAPTGYLTGIKTALELAGLCSGRLAEPLYTMPEDRRRLLRQHLDDLGLLASVPSGERGM